jgi:hypothetical protein
MNGRVCLGEYSPRKFLSGRVCLGEYSPAFWASKFAPKFMLTIPVFEINKGKNAQKVKKN